MSTSIQHLPESFESERLILRVPRSGDGQALYEAVLESHDRLKLWFPWAQTVAMPDVQEQFVCQAYSRYLLNEDMVLGLFLKEDGKLIGGSGMHFREPRVPSFEIGYWIRNGYEGKGYVSEAVRAITRFGFETAQANRMLIRCDSKNVRSQAVARRAGYIFEGTFRNFERNWNNGELVDMMFFALTAEDYCNLEAQ